MAIARFDTVKKEKRTASKIATFDHVQKENDEYVLPSSRNRPSDRSALEARLHALFEEPAAETQPAAASRDTPVSVYDPSNAAKKPVEMTLVEYEDMQKAARQPAMDAFVKVPTTAKGKLDLAAKTNALKTANEMQYWYDYDVDAAQKKLDALEYEPIPFISADWWKGVGEEFATAGKNTERNTPQKEKEKQAQISQLSQEINTAKKYQQAKRYYDLTQAEDFATVSADDRYKGTNAYDAVFGRDPGGVESLDKKKQEQYYTLVDEYGENSEEAEQFLLLEVGNGVNPIAKNMQEITDEEKALYNYILIKQGEDAAKEYIDYLQDSLNERHAVSTYENLQKNRDKYGDVYTAFDNIADVGYSFGTGVKSGVQGLANVFIDEAKPLSDSEYLQSMMREDAGFIKGIAMDSASSIGNMVPSIGLSLIHPVVGTVSFGLSAGGNAKQEALRQGYTAKQATNYGILVGASEALLERILGGIPGLSSGNLSKATSEGVGKIGKVLYKLAPKTEAIFRTVENFVGNGVKEGFEEWVQNGLDGVLRNICFGENNEWKPFSEEALYDALVGSITSFAMNAPGISNTYAKEHNNMVANRALVGTQAFQGEEVVKARETLAEKVNAGEFSQADIDAVKQAALSEIVGDSGSGAETKRQKNHSYEQAKGVFDASIGTKTKPATQEQFDEYVDYAYRYANETNVKGNKAFPKQKESLNFGVVSDRAAADIQSAFGVDISGYENTINDNDIRHIKNSHGEETNEKYPVTSDDIKKIPDIVENFDDILYVPRKDGKAGIVFVKRHNGVTYYLEQIKDGNVLRGKQMIKTSTGTIPNLEGLEAAIHKKWGTTPLQMTNAPRMYVQDVWNDTATNSIPQSAGNSQGGAQRSFATENPAAMQNGVQGEKSGAVKHDPIEVMASFMGKIGQNTLRQFYLGDVPALDYAEAMTRWYNAGREGKAADLRGQTDVLNEKQREAAYKAGQFDAENDFAETPGAPGTVKVASDVKVSKSFLRRVEKLAKALDVSITIGGKAPVENGVQDRGYITSDGHIHIYGDATVKLEDGRVLKGEQAALMIVLGHEMTHRLQALDEDSYNRFSDYVLSIRGMRDTVTSLMETRNWSKEKAEEEAVCDFAMQYLFTDKKTIREVTRKHNKVAEAIRSFFEWVSGQLGMDKYSGMSYSDARFAEIVDDAARLWNDAYNQSVQNVKNGVEIKNIADGDVKYSKVGYTQDGIEAYETSDEVKALSYNERKTLFLDLMTNEYLGRTARFIRNGHTYYATFAKEDIKKNIYGDKISDLKGWRAKINVGAEGGIFDLVENSTYDGSKPESGKNIKAHRGIGYWDYFVKTVQIDGRVYDLTANVRKSESDQYIYSLHLRENKNKKAAPPLDTTNGVSDEVLTASNNNVPQKAPVVNSQSMQNSQNDASTEQKSQSGTEDILFDNLKNRYGTIKPGEKPARDVALPKKSTDGRKVSHTARTVMEAEATPDEMIPTLEQLVADGAFSYETVTDKGAIAKAEDKITKQGFDATVRKWFKAVGSGKVSKDNTALGWTIYNNAANSGDTELAVEVLCEMVKHQRNAAQALQASRILKKLSPSGQLYAAQKSVQGLQEELEERYGDKAPELKIDPTLADKVINGETEAEREKALADLYRDIGRQMPSSVMDKWNAWRYLSMLGNARTHIRNIVGNAGFAPVVTVKNITATGIESLASFVSRGKIGRTKAFLTPAKTDRALLAAAWTDYDAVADAALGQSKYNDNQFANKHIEEGRRIFKLKPLEAARRGNSWLLDKEDSWFSKPQYANALAQYCKANGITAQQIQSGNDLEKARAYAIKEAQKATYRDTNAFSELFSKLGRIDERGEHKLAKRIWNRGVEGVLPFRKTPANILARGVEYSPIGLGVGLWNMAFDVKSGKVTAAEAIDKMAAGLTGSGLMALGAFLVTQGVLRGFGGDDEKEKEYMELMGHQQYALEIGGTSVTLDWLAPEALPFFVGANIAEQTMQDGEMTVEGLISALGSISDPMLSMSCLQGLNDLIESVSFSDTSGVVTIVASAATSYLTQGIPTLFGQIERTSEPERMMTYTTKGNKVLTPDMQYTVGKVSAKLPGDYSQIPYIDAWGRTESSGSMGERAFNNMLNPAYTSEIKESAMEKELLRLYKATGESVLPSRADKYIQIDDERVYLTAEQYQKYATKKGQTSYTLATDLTKHAAYSKMADYTRSVAIRYAYEYANAVAKADATKGLENPYTVPKWVAKADAAATVGVSVSEFILARAAVADVDGGYTNIKTGETIENSESLLKMEAIYAIPGLTDAKRKRLFEDFGIGKKVIHYNQACVAEQLEKMRKQAGM